MTDIVMGNVTPLKKRIRELEDENTRLRKLLNDIQHGEDVDLDDYSYDEYKWDNQFGR